MEPREEGDGPAGAGPTSERLRSINMNGAIAIDSPAGHMGTAAPGTVGDGTCPAGANVRGASGHGASSASGSITCSRPVAQPCAWCT